MMELMDMDVEYNFEQEPKPSYHETLESKYQSKSRCTYPETLKDLCLKNIKNHSAFYLKIDENSGLNPFDRLPNSLKTELLGNEGYFRWGRWEQLLMNRAVTKVEIHHGFVDWDLDTYPRDFEDFSSSLKTAKPQLQTFIWNGSYGVPGMPDLVAFVTSLPYFAKLRKLCLYGVTCSDLQLQMIASHLKHLRVFLLKLEGVTEKGISAIATLDHLVEFPFFTTDDSCDTDFQAKMYGLCVKLMPKLQVIGYEKVCLQTFNTANVMEDNGEDFHINFRALPTPTQLGLRQLVLSCNENILPKGITFPKLTSLVLWHPLRNFQPDARFSKVTELGLFEMGMAEYLRVLRVLGHQIQRLTILEENDDLALDLILRLCPNLEEFHIGMSPKNLICMSALDPEVHLRNLTDLRVDFRNKLMPAAGCPEFAPGVLVQLLRAPKLHFIKLCLVDLTDEDAEVIVSLLQKGQILQNLQELVVLDWRLFKGSYFDEERRDLFDFVVENMIKHCPNFIYCEELEE